MKALVIGYGNRSRKDDGAGCHVIDTLAARDRFPAQLEAAHQLDLTLAETMREYDLVVFVDARISDDPEAWSMEDVVPAVRDRGVTHFVAPGDLLGLCQVLYGAAPRGVLFAIRGTDFDFGEGLSEETRRSALQVADRIEALVMEDGRAMIRGAPAGAEEECALANQG